MRTPIAFICVFLASLSPLYGQDLTPTSQAAQQSSPRTKLEQFQAKTGSVIIMGSSDVGVISCEYEAKVEVETREFIDASSGTKQFGVYIKVKEGGRIEREESSFIDLDEVESLIKGIEYIGALKSGVTKPGRFQADYRTIGDLKVSTFEDSNGTVNSAIQSGRIGAARAYLSLVKLKEFHGFLKQAQATLEQMKQQ